MQFVVVSRRTALWRCGKDPRTDCRGRALRISNRVVRRSIVIPDYAATYRRRSGSIARVLLAGAASTERCASAPTSWCCRTGAGGALASGRHGGSTLRRPSHAWCRGATYAASSRRFAAVRGSRSGYRRVHRRVALPMGGRRVRPRTPDVRAVRQSPRRPTAAADPVPILVGATIPPAGAPRSAATAGTALPDSRAVRERTRRHRAQRAALGRRGPFVFSYTCPETRVVLDARELRPPVSYADLPTS